ncbi:hypothetical protein QN345_00655 [Cryobacterium sp. 10I1]|uniref:hypothetical protein n=1 Tax=Cryobacterium sp. 10I1 TaxID=3048578 RepID=UPI002B22A9A3|nr:hypothetical protein [Cryobacterium sp. 10I1]MEB0303850.1 hypothetical protein [Cryobacterium sp. 10I1]
MCRFSLFSRFKRSAPIKRPLLTPIEASLLTPEHVNNEGRIALGDYLYAQGYRDFNLMLSLAFFRTAVVDEYEHVHGEHPPIHEVPGGADRLDYTFTTADKPMIDRVFALGFRTARTPERVS